MRQQPQTPQLSWGVREYPAFEERTLVSIQSLAPAFRFLVGTGRYRCRIIGHEDTRREDLLYSSDQVSISVVRDRTDVFVSLAPRHTMMAAYLEAPLLDRVPRGEAPA